MRPTVRVIHNLPRSGGTLLARCLGCMKGVVLLSEIHPNGSAAVDPATQARMWFNYPVPDGLDFLDTIESIRSFAETSEKSLVIRDWSFPDFMPRFPHDHPPSKSLLQKILSSRYEVASLSLLRTAPDVWKSLQAFEDHAIPVGDYRMSSDNFLKGYTTFCRMAKSTGFIRYEDLCDDPAVTLRRACNMLRLPFDEKFADKWNSYRKVTGDIANLDRPNIGSH
jgi:hypothetical protein